MIRMHPEMKGHKSVRSSTSWATSFDLPFQQNSWRVLCCLSRNEESAHFMQNKINVREFLSHYLFGKSDEEAYLRDHLP
jgi:hypothetical protein